MHKMKLRAENIGSKIKKILFIFTTECSLMKTFTSYLIKNELNFLFEDSEASKYKYKSLQVSTALFIFDTCNDLMIQKKEYVL